MKSLDLLIEPEHQVGRLDQMQGLHLPCRISGEDCQVLIDTGSTISLVRPGILSDTVCQSPMCWTPTSVCLCTVAREVADMKDQRSLSVRVSNVSLEHEFWLADIQDDCILGLDFLSQVGACLDVGTWKLQMKESVMELRSRGRRQRQPQVTRQKLVTDSLTKILPPEGAAKPPQRGECAPAGDQWHSGRTFGSYPESYAGTRVEVFGRAGA